MTAGLIGVARFRFELTEAFALWLLQSMDEFANYQVVEVKNQEEMERCDALIGVGDTFMPEQLFFSHHGEDFDESMSSLGVLKSYKERLSTAGLVYAVHGKHILRHLNPEQYTTPLNPSPDFFPSNLGHNFRRIYEYFVEVLDCFTHDENLGYPSREKERLQKYLENSADSLSTALASRHVNFLTIVDTFAGSMGNKFKDTLNWFYNDYLRSFNLLKRAFEEAEKTDASGQIVFCDHDFLNVNTEDLIERITSSYAMSSTRVFPSVCVMRSKDKYRVECLKYSNLKKSFRFARAGVMIYKVEGLVYFSDDNIMRS